MGCFNQQHQDRGGEMNDSLGDRMKMYEAIEHGRILMPRLPIYARLDGKCFSSFTRGMERPYDLHMTRSMIETTKYLVEETSAACGYTQSDEISLAWYYPDPKSQPFLGGKVQKLVSILAAMATAKFNSIIGPANAELPCFDCRVFNLPNVEEAANAFLWRELDATKNAVTMLAQSYFSHKELHGKNGEQKQEMLFQKHGVNFNDMPAFFKRGTFVRRINEERMLTEDELSRIPEAHRPATPVMRSRVVELDMPKFNTVTNRAGVIFNNEQPVTQEQP